MHNSAFAQVHFQARVEFVQPARSGKHPVGHGLAREFKAQALQSRLLAVKRGAFHELLAHDVRHRRRRRQAVGKGGGGHGSGEDGCLDLVFLAMAAGILTADMLDDAYRGGDDLDFGADIGSHFMQRACAGRANLLLWGQPIVDLLDGEARQIEFALPGHFAPCVGKRFAKGFRGLA